MIKWLFKYGLVIFLFNTVLLNIESTFNIGSIVFISLMVIFIISFPHNFRGNLFDKNSILMMIYRIQPIKS